MGYEARLELRDAAGARWRGAAAPGFEGARDVFEALLAAPELDLARGAGPGPELTLPPAVRLEVFPPRGGWWPRPSPARQAHLLTHQVRAFGVAVSRPLAWLEAARAPGAKASFRLVAAEPETTLGQWWALRLLALREADRAAYVAEKRRCIHQLAVLLRTLEAEGYHCQRLTPATFGVAEDHVVLREVGALSAAGRRSDGSDAALAELLRDLLELGGLTRGDRMRFARVLEAHRPGPAAAARARWARVAALEPG